MRDACFFLRLSLKDKKDKAYNNFIKRLQKVAPLIRTLSFLPFLLIITAWMENFPYISTNIMEIISVY